MEVGGPSFINMVYSGLLSEEGNVLMCEVPFVRGLLQRKKFSDIAEKLISSVVTWSVVLLKHLNGISHVT